MRDPNRIGPFLGQLACIWRVNPDLRFGQIFDNLRTVLKLDNMDIFHVEDDELLRRLKKFYNWNNEDIDDN